MIDKDPTRGHIMFSGDEGRREILTPTVAAAVFRAVWNDNRLKTFAGLLPERTSKFIVNAYSS